jgi:hypothetical protein
MQVQLSTRIEEDVAEQLAEIANREKRSVSAQVAWIVERFIAAERETERLIAAERDNERLIAAEREAEQQKAD